MKSCLLPLLRTLGSRVLSGLCQGRPKNNIHRTSWNHWPGRSVDGAGPIGIHVSSPHVRPGRSPTRICRSIPLQPPIRGFISARRRTRYRTLRTTTGSTSSCSLCSTKTAHIVRGDLEKHGGSIISSTKRTNHTHWATKTRRISFAAPLDAALCDPSGSGANQSAMGHPHCRGHGGAPHRDRRQTPKARSHSMAHHARQECAERHSLLEGWQRL